ncbi:type II toxin-antitoxin system VapC family toxin [soil metagenome]
MNLLLDTHILIWIFANDPRLSALTRATIADANNQVFVSSATAWEIAIKRALGKLEAPKDYSDGLKRYRFTPLDITTDHALAVEDLPPHHDDPFDRMLIAQAKIEQLTLVTRDRRMRAYDVRLMEA